MMEPERKEFELFAIDDEKATAHGIKTQQREDSDFPADFAAFLAAPAAASTANGQTSSPLGSTLPHFDAFGSEFAAAVPAGVTQAYRTPFDSPDPILMPEATSQGGEEAAASATAATAGSGDDPSRPRTARSQSYTVPHSSGSAFDAQSIFHAPHPHSSKHKHRQKQQLESASSASGIPKARKSGLSSSNLSPPVIGSAVHASSSASNSADPKKEEDPVFDGIIPEAVFSGALLARRTSEPTLGSRRAAEAAAARAAAAAAAAANGAAPQFNTHTAPGADSPSTPVDRRLTIHVESLPTDKASNINLDPLVKSAVGVVTPRLQCKTEQCNETAFACGYCAAHLTSQFEPATPTTIIRRVHGLWSRHIRVGVPGAAKIQIEWQFWKRASLYDVKLWEDPLTGERTVIVNGKVNYRSRPPGGSWKLSMLLGRGKSSAFEVMVEAVPRSLLAASTGGTGSVHLYPGPLEFELWLDGFPFAEAQNNFMSELGAAQQAAMIAAEAEEAVAGAEAEGADASAAAGGWGPSSSSSSSAVPSKALSAKARHYANLHYIHTHWHRSFTASKTRLGYVKNRVEWAFTLGGPTHAHTLRLTHSEKSGKRALELDGKLILVHKPNWINGLLLQRSSSHRFECDGTPMEVRIQKLDWSHLSKQSSDGSTEDRPSFSYDLLIGGVSFHKCTKTLPEYAGGMVDVEATLREQERKAKRKKDREEAIRRDPRVELSPE